MIRKTEALRAKRKASLIVGLGRLQRIVCWHTLDVEASASWLISSHLFHF